MKLSLLFLCLAVTAYAELVDRESKRARKLRELADTKVLAALADHGSDMRKPHALEHHFIVASEPVANALSEFGNKKGYRVLHPETRIEKDGKKVWFLDLMREVVPTKDTVFEETRIMTMIADHFHATYDGWGCDIVK